MTFNCAEQYMMYCKALHFNDYATAAKVMETKEPSGQKKLGRRVVGFDPGQWDTVKLDVVVQGNISKFTSNTTKASLKRRLLATGDRLLVEVT